MSKIERVETVGVLMGDLLVDVCVRIWEPKASTKSVICTHGFAGTSEDFAQLAETLVDMGITVIAPDMFGRGASTYFHDSRHYSIRNYLLPLAVTNRYRKDSCAHLGSSWGGLITLAHLATIGWNTKGAVLNDIPIDSSTHVSRTRSLLVEESGRSFSSREEAEDYILNSRSMNFLTGKWRDRFTQSRLREENGKWLLRYDPALAVELQQDRQFSVEKLLREAPKPVLMCFGEASPYATDPRNREIAAMNPNITLIDRMDDPHPPSLMKAEQILTLAGFFSRVFG